MKKIYVIRHAESEANAAVDLDAEPDLSGLEEPALDAEGINTTVDNTVPPAEGEQLI